MIISEDFRLQKTTESDTSQLIMLMMMNTIGLSIIYAEFKSAYNHYSHPSWKNKASSDSLAFIEGTGLNVIVENYYLGYDADRLRNVFFSMVGDHEKIK